MLRPLVPEATLLKVLTDRLSRLDCVTRGWVLHGYPRTREQAEQLSGAGYSRVRTTADGSAAQLRDDARQTSESSLTSRAPFSSGANDYSDTMRRRHALPKSVHQAVVGVSFIADHLKQQDENDRVKPILSLTKNT